MRSVKVVILFLFILYSSQLLFANIKNSGETVLSVSQGFNKAIPDLGFQKDEPVRFEFHVIESRHETPYFISKEYGVTVEDIYKYNSDIKQFRRGATIRIPIWDVTETSPAPDVYKSGESVSNVSIIEHRIVSGETLWGIAHKYDVSEADLKVANPVLNNSFPAGAVIKIPVKTKESANNTVDVISTVSCQPLPASEYSNTIFNVALFLPLFLETNYSMNIHSDFESDMNNNVYPEIETVISDTVVEIEKNKDMFVGFYRNTEDYLQFYEGVLLAVDSMQKQGMKIRLNVYDTQENPAVAKEFLSSGEFLNTDLIIGPVFQQEQKDISAFSAMNRIFMISPLMAQTDEVLANPYFYQINPDRDYLLRETAEMVVRDFSNCNFIVFKTGNSYNTPETRMADLIREKFNGLSGGYNARFRVYDFKTNGIAGLTAMLSPDRENVIFIPSSDEGELSIGLSNLNNLADKYQITLIGTNQYPRYESIQLEYFHNLKLTYIAPYWTDYENTQTVNYIEKFKRYFYTEPNNFGRQGYDVAFYFLNALKNYGRDFRNYLPELKVDLIQGNYRFEKVSQLGGYVNRGVSVITYTRDYDVLRRKIDVFKD
ncbi:MAG: LysM peptidoglycan-binding domain-containing protein [Bacteroidales bacterium]|jgi:LysM repeat protein/ABC-type branched-subunit amino acid transport system substrate-binding protein|nr:LysM peptidoglycan-binding domain-containing protein [Bacteroidales bacterium]